MHWILYIPLLLALSLGCRSKSETHPTVGTNTPETARVTLCTGMASTIPLGNWPPPALRTGIGTSHLTLTTRNPQAQRWFDQGLNLLHDFWHIEAYRAFQQAIKADSSCPMGYWGLAMCQPGFGGTDSRVWVQAIDKANTLKANSPPFHKALIEASTILVKLGIAQAVMPFRNLYKTYSSEPEALAFAAIVLRQQPDEALQQEAKTLLETAFGQFPTHIGLLHYYVHVMELRPEFSQATEAARRIVSLAPNAPHLTHMPGHLFFRAGQYQKAADVFRRARQQEMAYHRTQQLPLVADQNYMHNLHYLAVSLAELGQKDNALEAANAYAAISLGQTPPTSGAALMLLYEGRILPTFIHIRYREFAKANETLNGWLNSLDMPLTNPLVRTYLQAMQAYCRGMAAIDTGNGQAANQYGMQLTQLLKIFEQQGIQQQGSAEFKAINETFDILSMARYELAGWIDNMDETRPFNNSAWNEALELEKAIQYDEPPRLMYPIGESLGRLHLYRHDTQNARLALAQALQKRPKSPFIRQLLTKNTPI
ncbi:tetratricopeptide repeat protein [Spirosoma migulaei]